MARTRGAFRYPVDLRAWLHTDDRPASQARLIDLSRTGAGIHLVGGAIDHSTLTDAGPFDTPRFLSGQPIRLAVADVVDGRPVTRQWHGLVAHARYDGTHEGGRIGLNFQLPSRGVEPDPASDADRIERAPAIGLGGLLDTAASLPGVPSFCTGVAASALAADQLSKAWVWASMGGSPGGAGDVLHLVPHLLSVVPAANSGTVASLGEGIPLTARLCALGALTLAAMIQAGTWHRTGLDDDGRRLAAIGGALLTAGLLGNSIDRLALGYVRDFLVSGLLPYWSFNLADVFLVAGALALLSARPGSSPHRSAPVHPGAEARILI